MNKIRISENELKQIVNESVISILKENFDYTIELYGTDPKYGTKNIAGFLQIKKKT